MESLPARQPTRRASPPETAQPQSSSSPVRTRSEDSQTIFVQNKEEEDQQDSHDGELQEIHALPHQLPQQSEEVSKCWICLLDQSEDTPESSPWRSPCPCALTAHEACLLDWIADVESPTKNQTKAPPPVQCPQCKSEIRLSRPRDVLVELFQAAERSVAYTFPKAALLLLGSVLYGACAAGGVHSIYAVFGPEEGGRILAPVLENAVRAPVDAWVGTPQEAGQAILGVLRDHLVHWRLYVGLPLITPALILSRTSLADGVLPILPVLFFVTQGQRGMVEAGEILQWPPSAEFAFAVLPYVRGVYNAWYKHVWAERKKKWLEELRPRAVSGDAADEAGNAAPADNAQPEPVNDDEEENVVEIRIDGGIFDAQDDDEDEDDDAPPPLNPDNPHPAAAHDIEDDWDGNAQRVEQEIARHLERAERGEPLDFPQFNDPAPQEPAANIAPQAAEPAAAPQVPDNGLPAAPAGNRPVQQRDVLAFSPTGIAQTVIGALLFPTLAGLAGEALKVVLPRNWIYGKPQTSWIFGNRIQKTFLGAKWARTLVGGCLLVLGKDALVLYVRWRMAQMQRHRSVVDYDRNRRLGGGARA